MALTKKICAIANAPKTMKDELNQLKESGIREGALKKGDYIKNFTLGNAVGKEVSIADILKEGPIILNFYRGGWCPYCNRELKGYRDILEEIKASGGSLVAISPEVPDEALNTIEKNSLEFEVLSDIDNKVAKEFGLVFKISEKLNGIYKELGIDLEKSQGKKSLELPIPATYVINTDGKIEMAFINEDYKKRLDPREALAVLKSL